MSQAGRERPILYFLVEESDREFRARSLMTAIAARGGFDVVIAPQWNLWDNVSSLPPGIMMFKGSNQVQTTNMHLAKQAGHVVASIEEEVLGLADEVEIRNHYASGAAAACDLFLVQGRFQAGCLARHGPEFANRSAVVGNPRADLLRPPFNSDLQSEAKHLRERFGEFVLLNANYGAINPAHGDSLTFYNLNAQIGMLDPASPGEHARFVERLDWEHDNSQALIMFAQQLAKIRPETNIILRPHPAESIDRWHKYLGAAASIQIIRDGGHLAWTLASAVMVHTGCTTGLEAAILDTPALSLVPSDNPWHAAAISNVANPTARTPAEAVRRVVAHLDGHQPNLLGEMRQCDYSTYLDHQEGTLSAHRVVDALTTLRNTPASVSRLAARPEVTLENWSTIGGGALLDWQKRKYTVTLDHARQAITADSTALGYSDTLDVSIISGGAIAARLM